MGIMLSVIPIALLCMTVILNEGKQCSSLKGTKSCNRQGDFRLSCPSGLKASSSLSWRIKRPERLNLRPKRADLGLEKPDLRPERPYLRFGRLDRVDLRP